MEYKKLTYLDIYIYFCINIFIKSKNNKNVKK